MEEVVTVGEEEEVTVGEELGRCYCRGTQRC
jgi:hypothetical protein